MLEKQKTLPPCQGLFVDYSICYLVPVVPVVPGVAGLLDVAATAAATAIANNAIGLFISPFFVKQLCENRT